MREMAWRWHELWCESRRVGAGAECLRMTGRTAPEGEGAEIRVGGNRTPILIGGSGRHRIPEAFSAFCIIVSLTAANTSRIFEVSVACVRL